MADRKDRVRVHVEGKEFSVVGGEFQAMLAAVKQVNGRRFISELKVWQLPGTVEDVRHQLEISGYQLEGGTPVAAESIPPRPTGDRIRVLIGQHHLAVVGGTFQDMLSAVKELPGRRFNGESKEWEIPGEVGVIKGMIEAAGFQLEGADEIPVESVPAMERPDFTSDQTSPMSYEPPDFTGETAAPPFEPPDWLDSAPPPPLAEGTHTFDEPSPLDEEPNPFEAGPAGPVRPAASPPTAGSDQIRLRLGDMALVVSGGSFQAMLTAVKNIPGRRFNSADKVWEIPDDIDLDSVQQTIKAAGFVLMAE